MLTKRQRARKIIKRFRHRFQSNTEKHVLFIAGAQRSGTNFLSDVLDRCWDTECFHENDDEAFRHYELKPNGAIGKLVRRSRASLVLFKSICDSQRVSELLNLFPDSQCLWAFRRYTDVINSSLNRFDDHGSWLEDILFHPEKARWRLQNVSQEDLERVRYFYDKKIDDVSARALIWYLRNIQFFQQKLDQNPKVRLTRYETLVTDGASIFPKIFAWLQIQPNPKAYKIAFSSSIGKENEQPIDEQIQTLCNDLHTRLEELFAKQW